MFNNPVWPYILIFLMFLGLWKLIEILVWLFVHVKII